MQIDPDKPILDDVSKALRDSLSSFVGEIKLRDEQFRDSIKPITGLDGFAKSLAASMPRFRMPESHIDEGLVELSNNLARRKAEIDQATIDSASLLAEAITVMAETRSEISELRREGIDREEANTKREGASVTRERVMVSLTVAIAIMTVLILSATTLTVALTWH
jgi:hypothetical protein